MDKKKKIIVWTAAAIVVVAGCFLLTGKKGGGKVSLETAKVSRSSITNVVTATGPVESVRRSLVLSTSFMRIITTW